MPLSLVDVEDSLRNGMVFILAAGTCHAGDYIQMNQQKWRLFDAFYRPGSLVVDVRQHSALESETRVLLQTLATPRHPKCEQIIVIGGAVQRQQLASMGQLAGVGTLFVASVAEAKHAAQKLYLPAYA